MGEFLAKLKPCLKVKLYKINTHIFRRTIQLRRAKCPRPLNAYITKIAIFRRERSDDRKCVCCSQAKATTEDKILKTINTAVSKWL